MNTCCLSLSGFGQPEDAYEEHEATSSEATSTHRKRKTPRREWYLWGGDEAR